MQWTRILSRVFALSLVSALLAGCGAGGGSQFNSGGSSPLAFDNALKADATETETNERGPRLAIYQTTSGAYNISASASPSTAKVNDTVRINASVSSSRTQTCTVIVDVFTTSGIKVKSQSFTNQYMYANALRSFPVSWVATAPPDGKPFIVKAGIYSMYGSKLASNDAAASITVTNSVAASSNPFVGQTLYVDPNSNARQQYNAWKLTRPADATAIEKIARNSQADWLGDWSGDIYTAVQRRMQTAASTGTLPVLVAYNIPNRDLGGYSGGGGTTEAGYKTWIRQFASAIGTQKCVVILEPDALAHASHMTATNAAARIALLKDAVDVLSSYPNISLYIDAGNCRWLPASTAANLLNQVGIAKARGFSLNVSNFYYTSDNVAYGKQIISLLGSANANKKMVIDTSRNGRGPSADGQIFNPAGRGLGYAPTPNTNDTAVDAFLWIKRPGESDGPVNGGPSAGAWWADYALGLCQRAVF